MIYILGMSHAISVVDAFAGPSSPFSHQNWTNQGRESFHKVPAQSSDSPVPEICCALLTPSFGPAMIPHPGTNGAPGRYVSGRYVRLLRNVSDEPGTVLVTMINGNEHSLLSMIQHPVPFDFVLPWQEDAGVIPGRQIVPYPVVSRQMIDQMVRTRAIFEAIRIVRPRLRVVQVLPPPPIPSDEQITRSQEPFVAPRFRKNYGLTPVSIRLKYYALYARELTSFLNRLKVRTLAAPAEATSPDGSLLERYWLGATHGNPDYGHLVLKQIVELVRAKE